MLQHHFYGMYLSDSKVYLINHLKMISTLCKSKGIKAALDCANLNLSLTKHHAQLDMYPQFLEIESGKPMYTNAFNEDSVCFIGWRPYQALITKPFNNKMEEKQLFQQANINIPNYSFDPNFSDKAVIVKNGQGSFSTGIHGPFESPFEYPITPERGEYYEEFIEGRILKLNYWNETPVFVDSQNMPTLQGNGKDSILTLATQQALARDRDIDLAALDEVLCFHDLDMDTILPDGKALLIDFRYESSLSNLHSVKEHVLPHPCYDKHMEAFKSLGNHIFKHIQPQIPYLYYSVDFIEDKQHNLWALEINTNPCVHYCSYPYMIDTLCGDWPDDI